MCSAPGHCIQSGLAGSALKIGDRKRCLKGAGAGLAERWQAGRQAGRGHLPVPVNIQPDSVYRLRLCLLTVEVKPDINMLPQPFPTQGQDRTYTRERTDCLSDASQMRPINRIINNKLNCSFGEINWRRHVNMMHCVCVGCRKCILIFIIKSFIN